jgi:hypothetical protein
VLQQLSSVSRMGASPAFKRTSRVASEENIVLAAP